MNSSRLFGIHAFLLLSLPGCIAAISEDRFNYRETVGNDYGPEAWDQVECDVVGECPGWPDGWELAVGWELTDNICRYCPASGNNCGLHSQSPIDLLRSPSTTGHDTECHDYHWMAYEDMSCQWHDIIKNGYTEEENNFRIRRHALQVLEPVDENGNLRCDNGNGKSAFPRLDYSKGFPNWWHLSHTEVTVPSEHFQEGKQYAAEVHLAHFYEINFERKMGKVAIFLDPDETKERWPFLDKLICQWREVEEKTRDECGLASVPPYPGCRNPTRGDGDTDLPYVDPYPFIDCDSVENSFRICKPTSCCEETRGTTDYCVNEVYEHYGDETVGSICWWCCPGKLLAPSDSTSTSHDVMTFSPITQKPSLSPTVAITPSPQTKPIQPTPAPSSVQQRPSASPISVSPTLAPTNPVSLKLTSPPSTHTPEANTPTSALAGELHCSDYENHPTINTKRICKVDGCCTSPRSSTSHCHSVYSFFGEHIEEFCSDCCDPSRDIAPATAPHPIYPVVDCTLVDNPYRMCKPNSCCETSMSSSSYCLNMQSLYGDDVPSICWYCCSEPIDILSDYPMTNSPVQTQTQPPTLSTPQPSMAFEVTSMPMQMVPPTLPFEPTLEPSMYVQITNGPVLSPPSPSAIPSVIETGQLVCSDYDFHDTINVNRICKDGGCCDPLRSATDYCHFVYDFFGDSMGSVCNNCCDPSKELAPAPPTHPVYPEIQCSSIDNPYRICKPTSCCEETASTTDYCNGVYELYGESMGSVCWYCCSMPKEVDTSVLVQWSRRELTSNSSEQDIVHGEVLLPHGATIGELHLDAANFVVNENLENDYLQGIEDYRQRRTEESKAASEAIHESTRRLTDYGTPEYNYPNVKYSPYEWLREVKTEYYFRYEGGQMVPPCFETVHYRVMKDPILIHPDQLAELERLLAWRIAPKGSEENECQPDSAGRERPGSHGNAVDLNRPLQGYSNIHRKVFCECQDWTSKFDEDKAWCQLDKDERWFKKPYNFNV